MADTPNSRDFRELNKEGAQFVDILKQMNAAMMDYRKSVKGNLDEQAVVNKEGQKAINLAEKLSQFTKDSLKDARSRNAFEKALAATKAEQAGLEAKITTATGKRKQILVDQLNTSKQLTTEANKLTKAYQDLDKKVKFFDKMSDFMKDIPIIGKIFPEFTKAAQAARDAVAETGKAADGFKAGMGQLSGALSKMFAGFMIANLVKGFTLLNKNTHDISRGLGVSQDQARKFRDNIDQSKFMIEEASKSMMDFNHHLGTAAVLPEDMADTINTLNIRLGMSADTTVGLYEASLGAHQSMKDFTAELIGTVRIQNMANKTAISYKDVMKDVASASATTKLSIGAVPGALAKAAFETRKLGLSFAQLESASGNMLDFEKSIGAELEAELLLGRELNLNKAREAALSNDLVGFAKEITSQGITAEKFGKMNRIQQESIATALGMSRDQLAQMFEKQKAMKDIGALMEKQGFQDLELKQKLDILMENGLSKNEALAKLGTDAIALGQEELDNKKNQVTVQEQMNLTLQSIQTSMGEMNKLAETLNKVLGFIQENADLILKAFIAIQGLRFANMMGLGKSLSSMAKNASSTAGGLTASASSPTGFRNAAGQFAKAPTTSGNFFSKMVSKGKNLVKSGTQAMKGGLLGKVGGWIGKNAGKLMKGVLSFPGLNAILEGVFAGMDMSNIIDSATNENDMNEALGKRAIEALGSIGGTALGGFLGSFIPIPGVGTLVGSLGGEYLGRWAAGKIAENMDPSTVGSIGKFTGNLFFKDRVATVKESGFKPSSGAIESGKRYAAERSAALKARAQTIDAEDFTIRTHPKDTLLMAGGTKFGEETNALLRQLIETIENGSDVILNGDKVGQALALGSSKMR